VAAVLGILGFKPTRGSAERIVDDARDSKVRFKTHEGFG